MPQTSAAPLLGDVHSQALEGPGPDLALDIQGLPPAPDDPDLEATLSALDQQADLDQSLWQQHGLDQYPPGPTAEPSAALPDGQPPDAPLPATSTTASAPPSSPPPAAPPH